MDDVFQLTVEAPQPLPDPVVDVPPAPAAGVDDLLVFDQPGELAADPAPLVVDLSALAYDDLPLGWWRDSAGVLHDPMGIADGDFGFGAWYPEAWEVELARQGDPAYAWALPFA